MSNIAINVNGLGKRYKIGKLQRRHDTLRDRLAEARVFSLFKRRHGHAGNGNGSNGSQRNGHGSTHDSSLITQESAASDILWALRDVSFEVKRGEVVGIVGRNGAGKSTLLKILSRITEPTEGYADLNGRVASLLEVGTGFHPELTGRENIYLNGSILGMKRAEINDKFDEIVAFAEIEKFIDTSVKYYSSGMYVRLAFAVAAHLELEILLVDEVLAVGDMSFQKKCLGKMGDVARQGRTVLFVSHNMALINNLCEKVVYLEAGRTKVIGPTALVIQDYLSSYQAPAATLRGVGELLASDTDLDILEYYSCDSSGTPRDSFRTSEKICLFIKYHSKKDLVGLRIGIDLLAASSGEALFRTFDDDSIPRDREQGYRDSTCAIPPDLLKPGRYIAKLQIGIHNVRWIVNGLVSVHISVESIDGVNSKYSDNRPGVIMPVIDWEVGRSARVS